MSLSQFAPFLSFSCLFELLLWLVCGVSVYDGFTGNLGLEVDLPACVLLSLR